MTFVSGDLSKLPTQQQCRTRTLRETVDQGRRVERMRGIETKTAVQEEIHTHGVHRVPPIIGVPGFIYPTGAVFGTLP